MAPQARGHLHERSLMQDSKTLASPEEGGGNKDMYARAARLLDGHPDYRVLRALPPLEVLTLPQPVGPVRTAVVLDTETTGFDWETGKIIELAVCQIRFDGEGQIVGVGPVHGWLEDPGAPLSPQITRLTGLCDIDLQGRAIDEQSARELLLGSAVAIAHHANFDRPWIDARFPEAADIRWACSLHHVDWSSFGHDDRKLGGLLASQCGYFNRRHRADADVAALVVLLASRLPDGRTVLAHTLTAAGRPSQRLFAWGTPFEARTLLKDRGYRWHAGQKVWWRDVEAEQADQEMDWLRSEAGAKYPSIQTITWRNRHKA